MRGIAGVMVFDGAPGAEAERCARPVIDAARRGARAALAWMSRNGIEAAA